MQSEKISAVYSSHHVASERQSAFLESLREVTLAMSSKARDKFKSTVYLRNQGPIACTARVFYDPEVRTQFPEQLLASGLGWCWESGRRDPTNYSHSDPNLPVVRPVTLLTADNINVFLDDLRERDADDFGRWIYVFGTDQQAISALLEPEGFRASILKFLNEESGPVRIVLAQVSDMNYEYIFVPHEPLESVRRLLDSWGVDLNSPSRTRRYEQLYTAKLESLLHIVE
jgi:hypothetical protein